MTDQSGFTVQPARSGIRVDFDRIAEERSENEGMARRTRKAPAAHRQMKPQTRAENSDLERRVLAHERILQALIAHMAEAEPKFLARLRANFVDTMQMSRREHDFMDTDSYAEQFIRQVVRLGERAGALEVLCHPSRPRFADVPPTGIVTRSSGIAPTLLRVQWRSGIWEVTQNGTFYGDYTAEEHAVAAAQAAVHAIRAGGGTAEVARSTRK